MDTPSPSAQVSSGWTDTVKFIAPPGSTVVFAVDREAPRGDLLSALARLCLRQVARRADQTSEVLGDGPRVE